MKIRKRACSALVVCSAIFLNCFTTFAQITEVSCDVNYGVITFFGRTDNSGKRVTYTASEYSSDDILSIGEPVVQDDGSFIIDLGFETSGDYIIKIKEKNGSTYEKTIHSYISLDDRKVTLLNQINTGGEAEITTALNEMNFKFKETKWSDIKDGNLTSWLLKYIKEHRIYTEIGEIEDEYAKLNALYIINKTKVASIVSVVNEYAEILDISDDSQLKTFVSGATNAQKRALVLELSEKPATTPKMLKVAIEKANCVKDAGSSSGGGGSSSGGGIIKVDPAKTDENDSDGAIQTESENKVETPTGMFSDLEQAQWAKEAVNELVQRKVVSGYTDGTFRPNANVTREEFVKMVVVAFDIPYEGKDCAFLDVFENDWFSAYVGAAQECGIITGISDDIFGINKEITRQDAAVILKRAADYKNVKLDAKRDMSKFIDHNDISDYALAAVQVLYCNGTISGKSGGAFAPKDACTRAEVAKMIYGIIGGGSYE